MEDIYYRLRELGATPKDEICSCPSGTPIMVMSTLGRNPIHCLDRNLEVEPSTLPLPESLVDDVAHWAWVAGAIHTLEVNSGPYEAWSQTELGDLESPVNREGLDLRARLDPVQRCYYTLFQRLVDDRFVVPDRCPTCEGLFAEYASGPFPRLICETCSLVLVNP
jgi:predicted  nucleic acid-binding Zn ribbon protein